MKRLSVMLIFVPLAVALKLTGAGSSLVFLTAVLALLPLSALIGKSTEELAIHTGPAIGGLLNVSMGNAAELIIGLVALHAGLTDLVKASIAGSILANALLVLGASMLIGGLRHGVQQFDVRIAGISATMLVLAVLALSLEGLFSTGPRSIRSESDREALSICIALVLLILYGLYVAYTLNLSAQGSRSGRAEDDANWSLRLSIGALAASTAGAVISSELLVHAIEAVIDDLGVTELFLGIVLVPIIGNAAEHWSSMKAAHANDMNLTMSIAVGSSIQIAAFTAPILVLAGFALGDRLQLTFNQYELAALAGAVLISSFIAFDGESNWVEGSQLIAVYVIFGLGFFFLV